MFFVQRQRRALRKTSSLRTAHRSWATVLRTEGDLRVHHQKVSASSFGRTRDWPLLLSNCLSSGDVSGPALEANRCRYGPPSKGVKQNKNRALEASARAFACSRKAGCLASCQCNRDMKSLGFMKHLAAISRPLGSPGRL